LVYTVLVAGKDVVTVNRVVHCRVGAVAPVALDRRTIRISLLILYLRRCSACVITYLAKVKTAATTVNTFILLIILGRRDS
jgi:hypothetical protein